MKPEIPRKQPVVAIDRGAHGRVVVNDSRYEYVAELQAATLKAQKAERIALARLRADLEVGVDVAEHWYLDDELGIVRSKKKEGAG